MTSRVDDWPTVLVRKVEEWRERAFGYGTSDCCQFAGDIVFALTREDHRPKFPCYKSREEAERILAQYGGSTALITSVLGPSKPAAWALRGDLIAADFGAGIAIGVCLGVNCCAPGPSGLVFIPTAKAVAAWSV